MCLPLAILAAVVSFGSSLQAATVTARVAVVHKTGGNVENDRTAVWLEPLQPSPYSFGDAEQPASLVQKNKAFHPRLLVVRAGSVVQFPNKDPFFHNVFSLFEGKRFDLGLYEAGSTRSVRFDKPGISYIFCNIHAQMSAVVIAVDTPYHAVSARDGGITLPHVPPGKYMLHVWREGSSPEVLNALRREVSVTDADVSLGSIRVIEDELPVAHKNKYGRDYQDPQPTNPLYSHP